MTLFCGSNINEKTFFDQIFTAVELNRNNDINILLVDDDSDESYLFNEALEHAGLSVNLTNAHNGNQLYEQLQKDILPDLIFLDLNMPYKDGLESLKEIKKNPRLQQIRIIIYSNTKIATTVSACYKAGADFFVVKPDDFDGMVQVVTKICKNDWKSFERPAIDNGFVVTVE